MRMLTREQSAAWIGQRQPVDAIFGARDAAPPAGLVCRRFHIPDGTSPVHTIFRHAVSWLIVDRASVLVWTDEYGIWHSSEDWNLYYKWRRAMGDSGVIEDAEGHLFLAHEAPDAVSLLLMASLFGWGFCAVSGESRRAVRINHDGVGIVVAEHASALAQAPPEWR